MNIQANHKHFQVLNEEIRSAADHEISVSGCVGQRYIASGLAGRRITIQGTPGNALGAYLNGAEINVCGNGQDAVGDTMNDGTIYIHGSCGDAAGYAMRGGKLFIEGDVGYRAGIHMKAYEQRLPVLVVGGRAGSFLGEYQAGGIIVVLGIGCTGRAPVGYFCGTGMHGGRIYLRCDEPPADLPEQVSVHRATETDLAEIDSYLEEFCRVFGHEKPEIAAGTFHLLEPNTMNPYKQLYTYN